MTVLKPELLEPFTPNISNPATTLFDAIHLFWNAGESGERPAVIPDLLGNHDVHMTYGAAGGLDTTGMAFSDNGNATLNTYGVIQGIDSAWSAESKYKSRLYLIDIPVFKFNNKNYQYVMHGVGLVAVWTKSTGILSITFEGQSSHRAYNKTFIPVDGERLTIAAQFNQFSDTSQLVINGTSYVMINNGSPFSGNSAPYVSSGIGRAGWNNYYGLDNSIGLLAFGANYYGTELTETQLIELCNNPYDILEVPEDIDHHGLTFSGTDINQVLSAPIAHGGGSDLHWELEVKAYSDSNQSGDWIRLGSKKATNTGGALTDRIIWRVNGTELRFMRSGNEYIWTGLAITLESTLKFVSLSGVGLELFVDGITAGTNGDIVGLGINEWGGNNNVPFGGVLEYIHFTDYKDPTLSRYWDLNLTTGNTVTDKLNGVVATLIGMTDANWQPLIPVEIYTLAANGSKNYLSCKAAFTAQRNKGTGVLKDLVLYGEDTVSLTQDYEGALTRIRLRGANVWDTKNEIRPKDGLNTGDSSSLYLGSRAAHEADHPYIVIKDLYIYGNKKALASQTWRSSFAVDLERVDIVSKTEHAIQAAFATTNTDRIRLRLETVRIRAGRSAYYSSEGASEFIWTNVLVAESNTTSSNWTSTIRLNDCLVSPILTNCILVNNSIKAFDDPVISSPSVNVLTPAILTNVMVHSLVAPITYSSGGQVGDIVLLPDISTMFVDEIGGDFRVNQDFADIHLVGKGWNNTDIVNWAYAAVAAGIPVDLVLVNVVQYIESGVSSLSQFKSLQELSAEQSVFSESVSIEKQIALAPSKTEQRQEINFVDVLKSKLLSVAASVQYVESAQIEASKLLALNALSAEQIIESQSNDLSKQIALAQHSSEQTTESSLVNILSGTQLNTLSIEQAVESIVATVEQQILLTAINTEQAVISSQINLESGAIFVLNNSEQEVVSTTVDIDQVKSWITKNNEQLVETSIISAIEIKQLTSLNSAQRVELSSFIESGSMPDIDLDNVIIVSLTPKYIVESRNPTYIVESRTPKYIIH